MFSSFLTCLCRTESLDVWTGGHLLSQFLSLGTEKGCWHSLNIKFLHELGKQSCQEWKRHRGWWWRGRERRRRWWWWWHDSDRQVSWTRWAGSCGQRSPGGGSPVACRPARKCHQGARVILLLCHKMWFTICLVRIKRDEVPLFHVADTSDLPSRASI